MPPEHSLKASPDSRFYRSTSPGNNPARAIKAGCLSSSLVRLGGGSIFAGDGLSGEHGALLLCTRGFVDRGDAGREFCSCEQHK